jgi:hypothetical protein
MTLYIIIVSKMAEPIKDKEPVADPEVLKVNVDRSAIEKELADQLEERAIEASKMQDQLAEITKQMTAMKESNASQTTEYEEALKEGGVLKEQLKDIAMKAFEADKVGRVEYLKESGVPEERIEEIIAKVTGPKELDELDWMITYIGQQFVDANEKEKKKDEEEKNKDPIPPASNPANPPAGSTVTLPQGDVKNWEFDNAQDAINALYDEVEKGGPRAAEANKLLDGYWKKFIPSVRNMRTNFTITQCPICETGIMEGQICPRCQFDPMVYKLGGGEFF